MDVLDFSRRAGPGVVPVLNVRVKTLAKIGFEVFRTLYGLFCLFMLGSQAWYQGNIRKRQTQAMWDKVDSERTRLWSLAIPPSKSGSRFQHQFFVNASGHSTHYVVFGKQAPVEKTNTLVIFIHGWPDSGLMWQTVADELFMARTFQSGDSTTVLAVDMPGYGASGSLGHYSPQSVLGTLTQYVAGMRDRYLPNGKGKVVIASHDWGAVVSWRLAAEAPEVADRIIVANGPSTFLASQNTQARMALFRAHLGSFFSNPFNLQALAAAGKVILPAIKQLGHSHYIFVFSLPNILSDFAFAIGGNFFSYYVAAIGVAGVNGIDLPAWKARGPRGTTVLEDEIATQLAVALGPNAGALGTNIDGQKYDSTVAKRTQAFDGKGNVSTDAIRYYLEGLGTNQWDFDTDTIAAINKIRKQRGLAAQPDAWADDSRKGLRSKGMPKAPVHILWGAEDPALEKDLMLEGAEEWVGGWKNITMIKTTGHWVPTERGPGGIIGEGQRVFAKCVADAVDGRA